MTLAICVCKRREPEEKFKSGDDVGRSKVDNVRIREVDCRSLALYMY